MSRRAALLCLAAGLAGLGCFRTQYVNLQPRGPISHHLPADTQPLQSDPWQHYFLLGWAPGEHRLEAAPFCGGTAHVAHIETERSAVQGLLAAFAGYSPYSGRVVCDHGRSFPPPARRRTAEVFPTEFAVTREFAADYETVWDAAIHALSGGELRVAQADIDTGTLVVPRFSFRDAQSIYAPLGHTLGSPHTILRREGRLVMSVQPGGVERTRVAIDVAMRIRVRTGNRDQHVPPNYEWREARSNLSIERSLLDRIAARLEEASGDVAER